MKIWQILKLTRKGHLVLWDGPALRCAHSKRLLKRRQKEQPKDKFFRYRLDAQ
jgi:hypothetical protein